MSQTAPSILEEIANLFRAKGDSEYGGEAVTQAEHALQAATLAQEAGASEALIVAALLHDIGHLMHDLPDDAPDDGIDDRHEITGAHWLEKHFPAAVCEPVKLHVPAKRYLCAVDPLYRAGLSAPSELSLHLQGGPMSSAEVDEFRSHRHFESAIQLRRWDDEAKVPDFPTPDLEFFLSKTAALVL